MKPASEASGVRNSWLALATKSARISSTRRIGVRSCTRHQHKIAVGRFARERDRNDERFRPAVGRDPLEELDALFLSRSRRSRRMASTTSGMRSANDTGSPIASAGASACGLGIEGDDDFLAVEHDHRVGQAVDHGIDGAIDSRSSPRSLARAGDGDRSPRRPIRRAKRRRRSTAQADQRRPAAAARRSGPARQKRALATASTRRARVSRLVNEPPLPRVVGVDRHGRVRWRPVRFAILCRGCRPCAAKFKGHLQNLEHRDGQVGTRS